MNMPGFTAEGSLYETSGAISVQRREPTIVERKTLSLSFPLVDFPDHTVPVFLVWEAGGVD
jgi:hypothetical protein